MQTKRDYLIGKGLAKPGRGKFSNAAKAELIKAEASGIKFAQPVIPTKNSATGNLTKKSVTRKSASETSPEETPYILPGDYRFPESEYRAVGDNGKTYSMRECCNTCKVSLVNHVCDSPTIHGNIKITIRGR